MDKDIELVESYLEESNLSDSERSTLYFISGYVAYKENIGVSYEGQGHASEFTNPSTSRIIWLASIPVLLFQA